MKIRALIISLLVLALVLSACQTATPAPSAEKDVVTVGYAAPGLVGGQINIQETLLRYAQEKGWQVVVTNSNGDAQKQNDDIDYFISLGVDAIVTVPQDSAGICAAAEKAAAAKIPFYTIDRSPSGCKINMTLLSDNFLAGQQAGEELVKQLTARYGSPKGTVLEITGDLGQNVGQLRRDGFHDVVDKNPEITVIQKVGSWDAQMGAEIVREVLVGTPDLDGIYMHSDAVYMSGTLAELDAAGKLVQRGEEGHIILVAVDGSPAGVNAIKEGWSDQSSNQPIPDFGLIVDFIEQELGGKPLAEGEMVKEGALWSPAVIKKNADGSLEAFLSTTSVTIDNAENPALWANFEVK
jgi:ABC-type sugar transport system substrate-binding protein